MNILVTGAGGQLGRALQRVTQQAASDTYFWTDVAELDITDEAAVEQFVANHAIDLIVNCAAYTDVNGAESDAGKARELNAVAPGILARVMRNHGGGIIHVSTDYVFGGHEGATPYSEEMPAAPLGVYGVTKLDGEWEVRSQNPQHVIVRTAWLYSETGKNFVRTMVDLTSRLAEVKVVFDQVGSPTYAPDLARAIVRIIEARGWERNPGLYHFTDEGVCSWFDLAHRVAKVSGHAACRVIPCHSDEYPSPVKRPAYSVLDKTKIRETFGLDIPYWIDSLDICIANLLNL